MAYKDQLALTGALDDVGTPIRENIGESSRFGIEIEAKFNFSDMWSFQPNIALSKNTNKDFYFKRDGILTYLGDTNLSYSPELVIGNVLIYKPSDNLSLSFLTKIIGDQYMSNIDSANSKLDSYSVSDLNVSYQLNPTLGLKTITINLLVNNILDKKYISNGYFYTYEDNWTNSDSIKTIEGAGYYPQAGINFILGLTIDF